MVTSWWMLPPAILPAVMWVLSRLHSKKAVWTSCSIISWSPSHKQAAELRGAMRRHTSGITATILALSAVALACSAPQSLPVFSPGALPVGEGVLRDHFDNNNLGWDNVSGAEGAT